MDAGEAGDSRSGGSLQVIEPATHAGCPDCAHMHWRWSSAIDPTSSLQTGVLGQSGPGACIAFVSPNFTDGKYKGFPIIPDQSHQDVDVAVASVNLVQSEIHPLDYSTIMTGRSIDPSSPSSTGPVLWYVGTGHAPSDSFNIHGGFFSSVGSLPAITNLKATPITGTSPQQFLIDFDIAQPLVNVSDLEDAVEFHLHSSDPAGSFADVDGNSLPLLDGAILPTKDQLCIAKPLDPTHIQIRYTAGGNGSASISVSSLAQDSHLQYQNQITVP